jgi:hypothetical protein
VRNLKAFELCPIASGAIGGFGDVLGRLTPGIQRIN